MVGVRVGVQADCKTRAASVNPTKGAYPNEMRTYPRFLAQALAEILTLDENVPEE